jgi:hypothetical protein
VQHATPQKNWRWRAFGQWIIDNEQLVMGAVRTLLTLTLDAFEQCVAVAILVGMAIPPAEFFHVFIGVEEFENRRNFPEAAQRFRAIGIAADPVAAQADVLRDRPIVQFPWASYPFR